MKRYIIIIVLLLILFSCFKNNKNGDDNYNTAHVKDKKNGGISISELPVDYKVLENNLGKNLIIVNFLKINLDSDIEEELAIAYKKDDSSNINLAVFDLFNSGLIKKNFEFESKVYFKDENFVLDAYNLFFENDIAIILEGKSKEGKFILNILSYADKNYKLVGDFTGDYPVNLDLKEIATERGKYTLLKEVVSIENSFSYANTNIQQKNIYNWDYDKSEFKLVESGQILASNNNFNKLFSSNEDMLEYLKGFWYPESYAELLRDDEKLENFNADEIEFISFSPQAKEVSIKYDDYLSKFSIIKTYRFWGHRPGVSINVERENIQIQSRNKMLIKIDVVLIEADMIQVKGPETFDEANYIRFPKPFIEIITDKKEKKISSQIAEIKKSLKGSFKMNKKSKNDKDDPENIILSFNDKNEFSLNKGSSAEKGYFIIINDNLGFIISFLQNTPGNILKSRYYLLNETQAKNVLSITPVKINYNSFSIDNFEKITFIKEENGEIKPN